LIIAGQELSAMQGGLPGCGIDCRMGHDRNTVPTREI